MNKHFDTNLITENIDLLLSALLQYVYLYIVIQLLVENNFAVLRE